MAGCSFGNSENLGLLGSFCRCRLENTGTEKAGAEAVLSDKGQALLFLAIRGLQEKAHVGFLHSRAGGAS